MTIDFSRVLKRALIAGVVVGLVLAAYLVVVVEPVVDEAIALEEAIILEEISASEAAASDRSAEAGGSHDDGSTAGHSHDDDNALFTRSQQVLGGGVASVIYALVLSGLFGTVFAAARHRLPGRSDFGRSLGLAGMAFGAVGLIPALKYPANPPAVGDPETVGERTLLWAVLVAVSLVAAWGLVKLSGELRLRGLDDPTRIGVVAVVTVAAYTIVLLVLPASPDEIDPAVPAALVWDFRVRSLGGIALTWAGLGLGLGWLLRDSAPAADRSDRAAA